MPFARRSTATYRADMSAWGIARKVPHGARTSERPETASPTRTVDGVQPWTAAGNDCGCNSNRPHSVARANWTRQAAAMSVGGINHLTLATADVRRCVQFYVEILGCRVLATWPKGAYLLAGDMWLALVEGLDETREADDYSHVAFHAPPDALATIRLRVEAAAVETWQQNWTEGDSIYVTDPSGHRIEVHSTTLLDRLRHSVGHPWDGFVMEPDAIEMAEAAANRVVRDLR